MLDSDLAALYGVETKVFNQAVKRNMKRFPSDFMFRLDKAEWESLRSQIVTSNRGGNRYLPFAFTEQGVAMLSGILNSDIAIRMNIAIMRAFIEVKRFIISSSHVLEQLRELRDRIGEHDVQLKAIYDAMENLLDKEADKEAEKEQWKSRERIGYKK